MSEPFIVAAVVRITRDALDRYLDSSMVDPATIDWENMFRGWYWSDKTETHDNPVGARPHQAFWTAEVAAMRSEPTLTCFAHDAESERLDVYCMSIVGRAPRQHREQIAALRGLAEFKDVPGRDYVLHWPEPSGRVSFDGMLSVSVLEMGESKFVTRDELLDDESEIEARFEDAIRRYDRALAAADQGDQPWTDAQVVDARLRGA